MTMWVATILAQAGQRTGDNREPFGLIGEIDTYSLAAGVVFMLIITLVAMWLSQRSPKRENITGASNQDGDRYATIFESANEGIVVLDADGVVTEINPAACRLFDTQPDDTVGTPATDLGLLSHTEIRLLPNLHRQETPQPVVRQLGERVISTIVSPLRAGEGKRRRAGSVWLLRDVTEIVRMDETRNEFISVVSHELRTPMTAIKGFTDLILDGDAGRVSDQQRELLAIVQANADRLVDLVNDMLDISRIESGRIQLDQTAVDLAKAIQSEIASLRPMLDAKQQHIQTELDADVPPIYADAARLSQILTNLLANASKYTPEEGWITIRTELLDSHVAVSVSDTGIGIPVEALPHLFTKFYRVEQPAVREAGGTGLGLAITRLLVERHGGRITIASRQGVGTTVRFTLPVARRAEIIGDHAGEPFVILVATADPRDRRAWSQGLESIPTRPVYPRSQTVRAIVGEAELHQPSVIVIRPQAARPGLYDLLTDLDAVPELAETPIVVVGGPTQTDWVTDRQIVMLRGDAGPDHVVSTISDLLPHGEVAPRSLGRVLLGITDDTRGAFFGETLIEAGFTVAHARDGLTAIVRAIETLPDAIVLDADLDRLDAGSVLHQLREYPGTEQIPVIVLAGAKELDESELLAAGASDIILEPVDRETLVTRLRELTVSTAGLGRDDNNTLL